MISEARLEEIRSGLASPTEEERREWEEAQAVKAANCSRAGKLGGKIAGKNRSKSLAAKKLARIIEDHMTALGLSEEEKDEKIRRFLDGVEITQGKVREG